MPVIGLLIGWLMSPASPFHGTRVHCAPHEHLVYLSLNNPYDIGCEADDPRLCRGHGHPSLTTEENER
jgi:hypothetical protein